MAEARSFVAERRFGRMQGLTLSLADGTDATIIEIDPLALEIQSVSGSVMVRTNHCVGGGDEPDETTSTAVRFARACDLADGLPDTVTRSDLFSVAEDHSHGPGPNSVCRHGGGSTGPYRLDQSTTVYRGRTPTTHGVVGAPCKSSPVEIPQDDPVPDELRTGRYWHETAGNRG